MDAPQQLQSEIAHKPVVLHLMRKFLPHTATFIRNQIAAAERYRPAVLYAERVESATLESLPPSLAAIRAVRPGVEAQLYDKFRRLGPGSIAAAEGVLKGGPALAHVHYGVDALVFQKALKNTQTPTIVSFYGYDCSTFPNRWKGWGKTLLQRYVFNHPAVKLITAMSPDMQADLLALGCPQEKLRVHYHGVPTGMWAKVPEMHVPASNGQVRFTIISGLSEKKGHLPLLEAFAIAQAKSSNTLMLNIVGEGDMRPQIEQTITRLNIEGVTLSGRMVYGSPIHLEILAQTDVFVHPSITAANGDKEGIPGALLEAMAAGLPVISTMHAGIPYIIESGKTGLLVPEHNIDALAEAMLQVATNAEKREQMGAAARAYAIGTLDIQARQNALENLYDEIAIR